MERIAIGRGVGYRVDDWLVAVGSARSEGKRLFVAAKGEDKLRRALRVIVGDLPSYTGSGPEGDAVVFFDAAVDLDDADFDEAGVAEGLTASLERVRVEVVVADDMAHVRAVLTFEDEESAQAIKKMVEGVLAMGQIAVQQQSGRAGMAESQAAAAVALLQGMDIEAAGKTLEVSLDVSTSLLEQLEHFEDDDD
ncbi:MAG: hypothetical protein D6824_04325 [Planctomycetota bacterium]|nr:MAG: hypothetical protein D6824_04325 [Planctomycetota bacterium]